MRTLVFAIGCLCILQAGATTKPPAEKILQVSVNESGIVWVGRDTVNADNLARYIQERLFKSYMGTGHMYSEIRFACTTTVPETVTQVIQQEIQTGQQRALTELCLQRYKKRFDSLDKKQQAKLKKQFPVLFQAIVQQSPGV